jgi:hypothetical protein
MGKMWTERVVALIDVLSRHMNGGTEVKNEESVRIVGLQADILTRDSSNMK